MAKIWNITNKVHKNSGADVGLEWETHGWYQATWTNVFSYQNMSEHYRITLFNDATDENDEDFAELPSLAQSIILADFYGKGR